MDKRVNRSHYKVIGEELIPKTSYETEKEALNIARNINILPQTIHKFVAYKCSKCGKWHVGRNRTTLTESEKEKILEKMKINNENIWKKKSNFTMVTC